MENKAFIDNGKSSVSQDSGPCIPAPYLYNSYLPFDLIRFYHPARKVYLDGMYVRTAGSRAKCLVEYSFDGVCNEVKVPLAYIRSR